MNLHTLILGCLTYLPRILQGWACPLLDLCHRKYEFPFWSSHLPGGSHKLWLALPPFVFGFIFLSFTSIRWPGAHLWVNFKIILSVKPRSCKILTMGWERPGMTMTQGSISIVKNISSVEKHTASYEMLITKRGHLMAYRLKYSLSSTVLASPSSGLGLAHSLTSL